MEGLNSFRATMTMEGFAVGLPVTVTTEVTQENAGRKRSVMTVETFGGRQEVEVVVAEPYAYVNLPDQGWLRVSGGDNNLVQALQIGSTGFFDIFPTNLVFSQSRSVRIEATHLGSGVLGGETPVDGGSSRVALRLIGADVPL